MVKEKKRSEQIVIEKMTMEHLEAIYEIEVSSFSVPWTKQDFIKELTENKLAIYVVAFYEGNICGYGGMWHIVNEGHITNIAVLEEYRQKGIGSAILKRLINIGLDLEMIGLTLEVRVGNRAAMKLYSNFGFKVSGLRKNYYSDTKEDAIIMWKDF